MSRTRAVGSVLACALFLGTTAQAAPPAKRPPKAIDADIQQTIAQFEDKHFPGDVVNPMYKRSLSGEAVPLLTKRVALWKEYAAVSPAMAAKARWPMAKAQAKLAFYDNADAKAALDAQADAADPADATAAKLARHALAWWEAAASADAQAKALDGVAEIAAAQPKDDNVAAALKTLIDDNPATSALAARAWDTIATLNTPLARELNAMPNKVGKPLVINGPLVSGKPFNSNQFKGKVVLIDFWATWCPPCREELPRLAKLYTDYHDKGLEIVGVSSDQDKRDLVGFLKDHPEMPWPQMFVGGPAWHPLTKKFGINSIPRMYLIDREGVLRTVTARNGVEKLVPELLGVESASAKALIDQVGGR